MPVLAWNRYGKSRIRLVKVTRTAQPHVVADLTIDVSLEGQFAPVYVEGDNERCVATDTMKNIVYALARQDPIDHIEAFALRVAAHLAARPHVATARVAIREHRWSPITAPGAPPAQAFMQAAREVWIADVVESPAAIAVGAGVDDLVLMKTTGSAFSGFPRDAYTTLPETDDRLLATAVSANWHYRSGFRGFAVRDAIRQAMIDTFASHHSRSVQHTLYAMGEAALGACDDVVEITVRLPNRHHIPVDLSPFGLDNPNEVFVATEQPFGLIEATVRRD